MSSKAMSLSSFRPCGVDCRRDGFEMRRPHTVPDVTQVVDSQPIRYGAVDQHVDQAMGAHRLAIELEPRVPVCSTTPRPLPAFITNSELLCEPLHDIHERLGPLRASDKAGVLGTARSDSIGQAVLACSSGADRASTTPSYVRGPAVFEIRPSLHGLRIGERHYVTLPCIAAMACGSGGRASVLGDRPLAAAIRAAVRSRPPADALPGLSEGWASPSTLASCHTSIPSTSRGPNPNCPAA